ncbi:MAG: DUF3575 domain-containing protein [Odoribacter splanchnicus]
MYIAALLAVIVIPIYAQEKTAAEYFFRFVAEKDMFFSPWSGNGKELERLLTAIEANRTAIESGRMYLCVTSYGTDGNAVRSASGIAKIRRNRVKSELILRGGVKESHFVTDKVFSESYKAKEGELRNVVVVMLPASVEKVAVVAGKEAAAKVEAYNREISGETNTEQTCQAGEQSVAATEAERERIVREQETAKQGCLAEEQTTQEPVGQDLAATEQTEQEWITTRTKSVPYALSLRANLLRWATLTPDLGIEWRICSSWSIMVNGSWTSWSWNGKDRRYALWEVAPEVRYYIGKEKRGYLGAMFKTGEFNYKLSETGKQGDLMGGGITGGYQLRLNDALSMDFSLGIGYLNADYEKYGVIDGVRVRQGKESKNWWGPVSAGVTLVWTIF